MDCTFCEDITEPHYSAISDNDNRIFIGKVDNQNYLCADMSDCYYNGEYVKINYCPVCGRKLDD